MAKYKVTNPGAPIEADYWIDIPIRDPETNKDAVDSEGRILVTRKVTRTLNLQEYNQIKAKLPNYDKLLTDYAAYTTENDKQLKIVSEMATTSTNKVTTLTETVNNHDLQINALYAKINAIQGIDIDDFKLVTETNIKNIKSSYLPLVGGTLTGSLRVQGNETEVDLLADNPSVGSIYLYATKTAKGIGAIGTNNVFARLADITPDNVITFYGSLNGNATSSTKTTNDSVDRNIVNTYALKSHYPDRIGINWDTTFKGYVNLTVDQTTFGLITTANIAQQAVNYANTCNKANSATTAGSANTAVSCTNANHAVNADTAIVADRADKANIADKATKDSSNNIIIDTYATKSSVASVNTTAADAAKKATDAYNAAIGVKTIADNANNAAVVAQNTANNAYNTAVDAGKAAATANTAATNANNAAVSASKAASDANTAATNAYNTATSANTAAVNANNNANARVHLTSAQTVTAQHNFSNGVKVSGYLITVG
jgi:hypothetical protein